MYVARDVLHVAGDACGERCMWRAMRVASEAACRRFGSAANSALRPPSLGAFRQQHATPRERLTPSARRRLASSGRGGGWRTPCTHPLATTCYHLLPLATTCYYLLLLATTCYYLLPLATTCYHLLPLATTCYHLLLLATTCYYLLPLATTCYHLLSFVSDPVGQ
jgi:hypothetical protein